MDVDLERDRVGKPSSRSSIPETVTPPRRAFPLVREGGRRAARTARIAKYWRGRKYGLDIYINASKPAVLRPA